MKYIAKIMIDTNADLLTTSDIAEMLDEALTDEVTNLIFYDGGAMEASLNVLSVEEVSA